MVSVFKQFSPERERDTGIVSSLEYSLLSILIASDVN